MHRISHMRFVPALALIFAMLLPRAVGAHTLYEKRRAMIQVSDHDIEILIMYEEPPGSRSGLPLSEFDINGDKKIDGAEVPIAAREFLPRMLDGLQFEVEGEKPRSHPPQVKFRTGAGGRLLVAAFLRWDLKPLPADKTRTVDVRVLAKANNLPTAVVFRAAGDLHITHASIPMPASDLFTDQIQLPIGKSATVVFAHKVRSPRHARHSESHHTTHR